LETDARPAGSPCSEPLPVIAAVGERIGQIERRAADSEPSRLHVSSRNLSSGTGRGTGLNTPPAYLGGLQPAWLMCAHHSDPGRAKRNPGYLGLPSIAPNRDRKTSSDSGTVQVSLPNLEFRSRRKASTPVPYFEVE